jgi:hypothetical protein
MDDRHPSVPEISVGIAAGLLLTAVWPEPEPRAA